MKKAIISSIIILMMMPASFAMTDPQPLPEHKKLKGIRSVTINSALTVVLGHFGNNQPMLEGDEDFKEQVIIRRAGDRLVIGTVNNKNLREKGVVYISAETLIELQINSEAYIQSSGTLNLPVLDIVVNGPCQVILASTGKMNFIPSGSYEIEYTKRDALQPMSFYGFRRK